MQPKLDVGKDVGGPPVGAGVTGASVTGDWVGWPGTTGLTVGSLEGVPDGLAVGKSVYLQVSMRIGWYTHKMDEGTNKTHRNLLAYSNSENIPNAAPRR